MHIDKHGNVVGIRRGTGNGKRVLMEGHMDTVFPLGTNPQPRREGTRVYAPGIVDDTRGMVVPLSVIRSLDAANIKTVGDLYFVGTVEEEGIGSFGGMKNLAGRQRRRRQHQCRRPQRQGHHLRGHRPHDL